MTRASLIVGRDLPAVVVPRGRVLAELARSPHDLTLHAERLARATARSTAPADEVVADVYAALLDLFIATGPDQAEVRRWALDEYGTLLATAEHDALANAIETGLHPASPVPPSAASLLTQGVTHPTPLVARQTPTAEPPALVVLSAPTIEPPAPEPHPASTPDTPPEPTLPIERAGEAGAEPPPSSATPAPDRSAKPWVRDLAVGAALAAAVVAWRRHRSPHRPR